MLRAALLLWLLGNAAAHAEERSIVWKTQDRSAIASYQTNDARVRQMVDALVVNVTGRATPAAGWQALVKTDDTVGIKVSVTGGRFFSTHRAVVSAIVAGLGSAGVPPKKIIIWDRGDFSETELRNLPAATREVAPVSGYDPTQLFTAPLMGKLIWGDVKFVRRKARPRRGEEEPEQLSAESHLARVLGNVTRIINVPMLRSDEGCGVAGALFNATVPNVDNWRRFTNARGAEYIGELFADERIRGKVTLHVMDGLIAQFAGGSKFEPNYAFHHGALYASRDPVALDATALREIERWRAEANLRSLKARAVYLETAAAMGLGQCEPEKIDVREVR